MYLSVTEVLKDHQKGETLCISPDGFGLVITHMNTHRIVIKMLLFKIRMMGYSGNFLKNEKWSFLFDVFINTELKFS